MHFDDVHPSSFAVAGVCAESSGHARAALPQTRRPRSRLQNHLQVRGLLGCIYVTHPCPQTLTEFEIAFIRHPSRVATSPKPHADRVHQEEAQSQRTMGADDLLPIVCYIVCQARGLEPNVYPLWPYWCNWYVCLPPYGLIGVIGMCTRDTDPKREATLCGI